MSYFEETIEEMEARHNRWLRGEIKPLNKDGQEATPEQIREAIARQRALRGLSQSDAS